MPKKPARGLVGHAILAKFHAVNTKMPAGCPALLNFGDSWAKWGLPGSAWVANLGADMFQRGNWVMAEDAQPVYLRDKVAKKKGGGY